MPDPTAIACFALILVPNGNPGGTVVLSGYPTKDAALEAMMVSDPYKADRGCNASNKACILPVTIPTFSDKRIIPAPAKDCVPRRD